MARYDYDPFGRSTTLLGATPTDFNFTGLYRHAKSNLDLAVYRAYDPDLGRWLSRDPFGNHSHNLMPTSSDGDEYPAELLPEGPNLYGYVANNPVNYVDPEGKNLIRLILRWLTKPKAKPPAPTKPKPDPRRNDVFDTCLYVCDNGKTFMQRVPRGAPCPQVRVVDFVAGPDGNSCPITVKCDATKL